jgi:apolipoprotein N-acyltransferase
VAIAPLIVASAIAASRQPARRFHLFQLGFVAGLAGFAGTLYWVVGVMEKYGGLATPVAMLVALLLCCYLAIYPGVFALLVGMAVR